MFIVGGLAVFTASCDSALPTYPKQLTDGCYYAEGKPVFKIVATEGRVLIPGEVQTFKVKRGGNPFRAWTTFSPAFTFDFSDAEGRPTVVGAYADREPFTFYMRSGASVPTVQMFRGGYGFQDVALGKPCQTRQAGQRPLSTQSGH
jgi:hypothetical protein